MEERNMDFGIYDETDKPYVVYHRGLIGYTRTNLREDLVSKVPKKTLKIMKKLLTSKGVEKVCMKKKPYRLVKTIKRY